MVLDKNIFCEESTVESLFPLLTKIQISHLICNFKPLKEVPDDVLEQVQIDARRSGDEELLLNI